MLTLTGYVILYREGKGDTYLLDNLVLPTIDAAEAHAKRRGLHRRPFTYRINAANVHMLAPAIRTPEEK